MYRQYARSKQGKRVNIRMSGKHYARIGLVAAQYEGTLLAPHSYIGRMKASLFEKWFEDKLLRCLPKGYVMLMDNEAFHKKEIMQNRAGKYLQRLIFLPPHSPECNPTEHTWSALNRKVASYAHLYDSVSDALDAVLEDN